MLFLKVCVNASLGMLQHAILYNKQLSLNASIAKTGTKQHLRKWNMFDLLNTKKW